MFQNFQIRKNGRFGGDRLLKRIPYFFMSHSVILGKRQRQFLKKSWFLVVFRDDSGCDEFLDKILVPVFSIFVTTGQKMNIKKI